MRHDVVDRLRWREDCVRHILDGSRGVYLPQDWERMYGDQFQYEPELEPCDLAILADGPDHDLYWSIWDRVLESAVYHDDDGCDWILHQAGGLYLVRRDKFDAVLDRWRE